MDTPITSYSPNDSSFFVSAATLYINSPSRQRQKRISITQTYYIAHTARKKLNREASREDHDLRLLVGHANLLDSLMLDYAGTTREHEQWFNKTNNGATKALQKESQHIQWASTVVEEAEEDWDSEDASDLESDFSESEDESDFEEPGFALTPQFVDGALHQLLPLQRTCWRKTWTTTQTSALNSTMRRIWGNSA